MPELLYERCEIQSDISEWGATLRFFFFFFKEFDFWPLEAAALSTLGLKASAVQCSAMCFDLRQRFIISLYLEKTSY